MKYTVRDSTGYDVAERPSPSAANIIAVKRTERTGEKHYVIDEDRVITFVANDPRPGGKLRTALYLLCFVVLAITAVQLYSALKDEEQHLEWKARV